MAHRLLIGKGMITLNLKRIFLTLTLLPLFAVAADDCALSDPTLTVQAYTVNPQTERVKMYWQKANGEAWGTLHALLADMNSQGQVQMAMNGGIYDESYAPLGLYIENGQQCGIARAARHQSCKCSGYRGHTICAKRDGH
jgi:uncharacterized protein YigE (DUF2233 family)